MFPLPLKISAYTRPRSLNYPPEAFVAYLNVNGQEVHLLDVLHREGDYRRGTMKGLSLQKSSFFSNTPYVFMNFVQVSGDI